MAVPHAATSSAYRLIDAPAVVLVHERYGETNEFAFDVRRSLADAFAEDLRAKRLEFEKS